MSGVVELDRSYGVGRRGRCSGGTARTRRRRRTHSACRRASCVDAATLLGSGRYGNASAAAAAAAAAAGASSVHRSDNISSYPGRRTRLAAPACRPV